MNPVVKQLATGEEATDELGARATEEPMHVKRLHATILHLMGFDHETDDGEMDREEHRIRVLVQDELRTAPGHAAEGER